MKRRMIPLLLCLCLLLSLPVQALEAKDFQYGALCGLAALPEGGLLAVDSYNKILWKVEDGNVSVFAGAIPVEDLSGEPQGVRFDGPLAEAGFAAPWDVAAWNGGWAVSDAGALRLIRDGTVSTVSTAFLLPTGLAADDSGNLYVAETGYGTIYRVSAAGGISAYVRNLTEPMGLCWQDGALYVAETGQNRILRIENGETRVLCGRSIPAEEAGEYYGGYVDGPADVAEFDHPQGLTVGTDGAVYVADTGNGAVRVLRDGRVDTLVRRSGGQLLPAAPRGLLFQADGTLCAADGTAGNLLYLSTVPAVFQDVPEGAWYAAAVYAAASRGLAQGVAEGYYDPRGTVSRAMFVTFLSRLYRSGDGTALLDGDTVFSDVPAGAWYAAAARWGGDTGLVSGVSIGISETVFAPESSVTREQIAVFLYRFAQNRGLTPTATGSLSAFRDGYTASAWAEPALEWAIGAGLMQGDGKYLRPKDSATRAETAALLLRFMDYCHM